MGAVGRRDTQRYWSPIKSANSGLERRVEHKEPG